MLPNALRTLLKIGIVLSFGFGSLLLHQTSFAQPRKVIEVEGAKYMIDAGLAENLKIFQGKRVYITLGSGAQVAGMVKAVSPHFLHLEKIDGKDFYDALIRIDSIVAIDARFRKYEGE